MALIPVLAIPLDGKLFIGGWFNEINGKSRDSIARLNSDGTLDPSLDPSADGAVYGIPLPRRNGVCIESG